MSLKRARQLGYKVEATEGTAESMTAAEFAGVRHDVSFKLTQARIERKPMRGSLTPLKEIGDERSAEITFMEEIVGGGNDVSEAAPWHTPLLASGFARAAAALKVLTIGSVTDGPYLTGQLVGNNASSGSATKRGRVVEHYVAANKLVIEVITGTWADADTVYNYATPQTSATVSGAPVNGGHVFTPLTESESAAPPSLTIDVRENGVSKVATGCRGTGSLKLARGQIPMWEFTMSGCPALDDPDAGDNGWPTAAKVTGIAAVGTAPSASKGSTIRLRNADADFAPILTTLDLNLNNTVSPRPTINDNSSNDSGIISYRITDRKIQAAIDPELPPKATADLTDWMMGVDLFEATVAFGNAANANGRVVVYGPSVHLSGEESQSDRDGIDTRPIDVSFSGDTDDEIRIYHVFI